MKDVVDRISTRACLTGPVASIRTPFLQDGAVDIDGLRRVVDFNIEAGTKTLLLTAGDSHYICLSDDEIVAVTKAVCEQSAGRAMVVAADRYHSTDRAVDLARAVKELGADVLMCMPPDWGQSCTPATLADHFVQVAQEIPVMMVTNRFIGRGAQYGMRTVEQTLDRTDNVVAIKDDMCGEFARELCVAFHERCAIIAGGQKQNHMSMWPYGCDGYLSTFLCFKPEISWRYWRAIEAQDISAATNVIRDYDMPFFNYVTTLQGGFDAGIHGAMELAGITSRWRRPPYYSLSDVELEQLADFLRSIDV